MRISANKLSQDIDDFAKRKDNPHQVTAKQVDTLTITEIINLFANKIPQGILPICYFSLIRYLNKNTFVFNTGTSVLTMTFPSEYPYDCLMITGRSFKLGKVIEIKKETQRAITENSIINVYIKLKSGAPYFYYTSDDEIHTPSNYTLPLFRGKISDILNQQFIFVYSYLFINGYAFSEQNYRTLGGAVINSTGYYFEGSNHLNTTWKGLV